MNIRLTRYYKKKKVEGGHIRGICHVLNSSPFKWGLAHSSFSLYYPPAQFYSVDKIEGVDAVIKDHGQPTDVLILLKSSGGRICNIETRVKDRISIDVDNKEKPPEEVFDAIEPVLALERLGEVTTGQRIRSAFIAHGFTEEGSACANELARFLALLGIRSYSGRTFAPERVSDKVRALLDAHDVYFGILTPQPDHTWITQETAIASTRTPLFILKQTDVSLKMGILGDHEYIPFPAGQLSKTFIPILEGLSGLRSEPTPLEPYPDLPD